MDEEGAGRRVVREGATGGVEEGARGYGRGQEDGVGERGKNGV